MMKIRRAGKTLVLLVTVSLATAAAFIRLPTLWPFMPSWLSQGFARAFNVESQEQAADVEFISAWVLCFGVLAGVYVVALAIWRKR